MVKLMSNQEAHFCDVQLTCLSIREFVEVSGLDASEINLLVELGIFMPSGTADGDWLFDHTALILARRMRRIREDFDLTLDANALALGFQLLSRIHSLEQELSRERASRVSSGQTL